MTDLTLARGQGDRTLVIIPQIGSAPAPTMGRQQETLGLVEALQAQVTSLEVLRVRDPTAGELLGPGQVEMLAERVAEEGVSLLVIDAVVTPVQQRNLERALKCKVVDRTGVILEIFGLRARTREGRVQVEMARMLYERSRLVRTWTHLERQRGGFGFMGGPGETQIEADRRQLDEKIRRRRSELADIRRTRNVQRAGRKRRGTQTVALVGYTNAGKSSLFNALSGASAFVKDMPFATLDPTVRQIQLPTGRRVELVDTVGFITDLPTHLVEAFRATLEETLIADLIVHVRDISDPESARQRTDVLTVLRQLEADVGLPLPPMLEVWNKVDLLSDAARDQLAVAVRTRPPGEPESILTSVVQETGLAEVGLALDRALAVNVARVEVRLTPAQGAIRAELYDTAAVLVDLTDEVGNSRLELLMERSVLARLVSRHPGLEVVEPMARLAAEL